MGCCKQFDLNDPREIARSGPWWNVQSPPLEIHLAPAGKFYLCEGAKCSGVYGMSLWPAGLLLAREVAARDWQGLTVLDMGAGLGLAGMVAARRGARVTFCDSHPAVARELRKNLTTNNVSGNIYAVAFADMQGDFDSVIAGDVGYAPGMMEEAAAAIRRLWNGKGFCLICDPGREPAKSKIPNLLDGLKFEQREVTGTMADGRRFTCDLWSVEPQNQK